MIQIFPEEDQLSAMGLKKLGNINTAVITGRSAMLTNLSSTKRWKSTRNRHDNLSDAMDLNMRIQGSGPRKLHCHLTSDDRPQLHFIQRRVQFPTRDFENQSNR